jgi:hypothetical protein
LLFDIFDFHFRPAIAADFHFHITLTLLSLPLVFILARYRLRAPWLLRWRDEAARYAPPLMPFMPLILITPLRHCLRWLFFASATRRCRYYAITIPLPAIAEPLSPVSRH